MSLIAAEAVWEYQAAASNEPPADPFAETVPVADWTAGGVAPFGTVEPSSDFIPEIAPNTAWTLNTGLWIRRNINTDGLAPVLLEGRCEQAMFLYFDGEFVGVFNEANEQDRGGLEWSVVIPRELATSGNHEVALLCLDDDAGGDASYISCVADYLPTLLPLQPQSPVKETLEWMTDVPISNNGTEGTRQQVRLVPRQHFQFSYPANALEQARANNIVYGARALPWVVPVWTQAQRLGAVAEGVTTLAAETGFSEFRDSSLALLWQTSDVWQVISIDEVGASLTLSTVTREFTDAWLMPLRFGFMTSNPKKRFNGYDSRYDLEFQVEDNDELTVAEPTQFLDEDIYFEAGLLSGDSLTDDVTGRLDIHDEELGLVNYAAPWLNTKPSRSHRVLAEGAEEAWALREWLHRRAGRYRAFWQPSFESDLRLESTGNITTSVNVSADEYRRYAAGRTHIAFETASGWLARTITNVVQIDGDTIQLTVDTALNVAASSVRRVCYLGLKRLNTDRVEINWIGGGVCQTEVRVLEIAP